MSWCKPQQNFPARCAARNRSADYDHKKLTKLLALYLPYILLGLVATNFGEAWRLAEGKELGDKIMSIVGTLPLAFANPLPSLHPLDLLIGFSAAQGYGLPYICEAKMQRNIGTAWNMALPDGVHPRTLNLFKLRSLPTTLF